MPSSGASVVGVGYTPLTRDSGVSVLELATQATRRALEDAGLEADDCDGVATFAMGDSVPAQSVATSVGITNISHFMDLSLGGQSPCHLLLLADAVIRAGLADTIVLYRALNGRSGKRVGREEAGPEAPDSVQRRHAVGLTAYPQYIAMWTRRFMEATGATESDLGAVAIAQREYARDNSRAVLREPLTLDGYFSSPMVANPFRVADCTREVDGACAIVVRRTDWCTGLRHEPVLVHGGAFASGPRPGREIGDILLWDDFSRNCMHHVSERLWRNTGMRPGDIDVAEIYDCFSSAVLYALEGLEFVNRGEAGDFIRDGQTRIDGSLPVNTHGGLLSEGYLHGMNTLAEAVNQLRGDAGTRTVPGASTAVVTSGTLMDGAAAVLRRADQ